MIPSHPQSKDPAGTIRISSPAPPPYHPPSAPLAKPIAIPATDGKLGSPFLRAYAPALERHGIPRETFLSFLDELNRSVVASPPLRVLGLAGTAVSFVPLHTAQVVGRAVGAAADLAAYGVSKGRAEACLRAANRELFGPRGLEVEIARLEALARLAGMPILDAESGKVDKRAPLLGPLEDLAEVGELGVQERRLRALEQWIEPLDVSLLPQVEVPSGALEKVSAAASERQRRKEEEGLMKKRHKAFEGYEEGSQKARDDYDKDMRKLERKEAKALAKNSDDQRKLDKRLEKVEKKRGKVARGFEEEMGKVEKDRTKDDKEEKGVRKILWLVIRSVDGSSGPSFNSSSPGFIG